MSQGIELSTTEQKTRWASLQESLGDFFIGLLLLALAIGTLLDGIRAFEGVRFHPPQKK